MLQGTIEDIAVFRDVMVPMRDGVRLATDITLPARGGVALPGPFPVLLHRTPYDKAAARLSEVSVADPSPKPNAEIAADLARAGYAVMMQDCRGRYASEGVFRKYLGEGEDGIDTLDWARAQPWCDGRFGTFGLSYSAHVQTALAALRPEGLAAMFLDSGGLWNAHQGGVRKGGAFELKQATWAYKHALLSPVAQDPVVRAALEAENIADWFRAMPWKRGHSPLRHVPEYEETLFEQWETGRFGPYWDRPEFHAAAHCEALARCPVFLICGWYDPYAETMFEHFRGLRAAGGHAELVMGPWLHGRRSQTHAGDVDFGAEAVLDGRIAADYDSLRRSWFDRWMKPAETAAGAETPAVRWFCMGGGTGRRDGAGRRQHGGTWRGASDWPPPAGAALTLCLSPDAGLSPVPVPEGEVFLQTDPSDPVPTIGGAITSGAPVMEGGAYDQVACPAVFGARPPFLPLAARRDVLVFATPPLAEPVEIAGPVSVTLDIATDVPDLDITIKLVDWAPPDPDWPGGFAMNLTDGILRLRYREGWDREVMLDPGRRTRVTVTAPPVAALFGRGHRIRLDIAGSNFPRFDVNPQSGEPEGQGACRRIATSRLFLGGADGAVLRLHRVG